MKFKSLLIRRLPDGSYEAKMDATTYTVPDLFALRQLLARIDRAEHEEIDEENIL